MSYQTQVQGYTVTSNVPFDVHPASGTNYNVAINFTNPVSNALDRTTLSLVELFDPLYFQDRIQKGCNTTITKPVITSSGNTLNMNFTASSPLVADLIGIILIALAALIGYLLATSAFSAATIAGIPIALELAALGVILLWLGLGGITEINTTLTNAGAGLGGTVGSDVQTLIGYCVLFGAALFVSLYAVNKLFRV